jgi:hypothetical protein
LGVVAVTSGGSALNLGAGIGVGGTAGDHDGRSRQLSGHQRSQRFAECRGTVF